MTTNLTSGNTYHHDEAVSASVSETESELNRAIDELRGVAAQSAGKPSFTQSQVRNERIMTLKIPLEAQVVLGSAEMNVSDLANLTNGSTIKLNRNIGDLLELVINGTVVAFGEIVIVDKETNRFGFRVLKLS